MKAVADLIERYRSAEAAASYRVFADSEQQLDPLKTVGREVMLNFPPMAGACAIMSAAYVARLQMVTNSPVFCAAGALFIGSDAVFGAESESGWESKFNNDDLSWDGHCWVIYGEYIADVSLLRTAKSEHSPPKLKQHVAKCLGDRGGLLIYKATEAAKLGLHYLPQYVLSEDQITRLFLGGKDLVERTLGQGK